MKIPPLIPLNCQIVAVPTPQGFTAKLSLAIRFYRLGCLPKIANPFQDAPLRFTLPKALSFTSKP